MEQESAADGFESLMILSCLAWRDVRLCFEPDSATLSLAEQVDQESTIKTRSAKMADLVFMAPATGIEPVTNP